MNGATISQTGNRYVFATHPTLTFTSVSTTKTYGDNSTTAISSDYTVTGLQTGVSGAFLSDTAATAYSGAPTVTSTGAATTANVAGGPYAITVANGTLSAINGYALAYASPGTLTIGKAALTITGANSTGTYTGLVQTNGYTTGTLYGSDTVTGVSGLATGTNAGTYADALFGATGSGLANYTIAYVNGGLTIGKAALTVTASNALATYNGAAWTGGNGVTYAGFVNGEGAGVLGGTLVYGGSAQGAVNAGSYALTAAGLTSGNYALSYTPGTLKIVSGVGIWPQFQWPSLYSASTDLTLALPALNKPTAKNQTATEICSQNYVSSCFLSAKINENYVLF